MEKFIKYGRFPTKLILNVALIILVTSSVIIMNSQSADYVQNASRGFYRLFFPGQRPRPSIFAMLSLTLPPSDDFDFGDRTCDLSTIEDAVNAVSLAVTNYYT